jgi:hypothetical protein
MNELHELRRSIDSITRARLSCGAVGGLPIVQDAVIRNLLSLCSPIRATARYMLASSGADGAIRRFRVG